MQASKGRTIKIRPAAAFILLILMAGTAFAQPQRYDKIADADAKNAWTACQAFFVDHGTNAFCSLEESKNYGYRQSPGVEIRVAGDGDSLEVIAWHALGGETYRIDPNGAIHNKPTTQAQLAQARKNIEAQAKEGPPAQSSPYESEALSDAKNAFTACQAFFTDTGGEAPCSVEMSKRYGYIQSPGVQISIEGNQDSLEIVAWHALGEETYRIDSGGVIRNQ